MPACWRRQESTMRRTILAVLAASIIGAVPAVAQASDDRWQSTLTDDSAIWDFRIVRLEGEGLLVRQRDSVFTIPVQRMKDLRLIRKSAMQMGTPMGGAMAALVGGDDEVYDLGPLDFAERLRMIQQVLLTHPAGASKP
jgi:hypothetical protein